MELANIFNNLEPNKIYGLMGNISLKSNHNNYGIIKYSKCNKTVKDFLNNKKDLKALQMVMLDETYLPKKLTNLSEIELKKINFAYNLLTNKTYLAFDYFEKGLNNKEKDNYKRLFKKLSTEYNKTIILYTNDLTFLWDICDYIVYIDNKEILIYNKKNYQNLLSKVDIPEISKFINLIHKKNIPIEDYKNVLDLLKAIYRLKE